MAHVLPQGAPGSHTSEELSHASHNAVQTCGVKTGENGQNTAGSSEVPAEQAGLQGGCTDYAEPDWASRDLPP